LHDVATDDSFLDFRERHPYSQSFIGQCTLLTQTHADHRRHRGDCTQLFVGHAFQRQQELLEFFRGLCHVSSARIASSKEPAEHRF
jgi:hypothetical protein